MLAGAATADAGQAPPTTEPTDTALGDTASTPAPTVATRAASGGCGCDHPGRREVPWAMGVVPTLILTRPSP